MLEQQKTAAQVASNRRSSYSTRSSLSTLVALIGLGATAADWSMTPISFPRSLQVNPNAINDQGDIAGFYFTPQEHVGFILPGDGGGVSIFNFPGAYRTYPMAVNNSGDIVGWLLSFGNNRSFRFQDGVFTTISGAAANGVNSANDINDHGQIVGESGLSGFLLDGNSYTPIDYPGANNITRALGINNAGDIVGSVDKHGFAFIKGTFSKVDFPGSIATTVYDINESGQMVGSYQTAEASDSSHGFLLSDGIFSTIGDTLGIYGINNRNEMVGRSSSLDGVVIRLVPEPSTTLLLLFGGIAATAFLRRPRRPV